MPNNKNDKKHIKSLLPEIITRLNKNEKPENIIADIGLSNNEWYRVASIIYNENKKYIKPKPELEQLKKVNSILENYAFSFPRLGSIADLNELEQLLKNYTSNEEKINKLLVSTIMHPNMRALYYLNLYSLPNIGEYENPIFKFASIIESSIISFYRGNYISSYMTIIPVIEGFLLRWQGFPDIIQTKPSFEDSLKYVKNTYLRQPCPSLIGFIDSWSSTALNIMNNHLFKDTSSGKSNLDFNRHLVAHLLYDTSFSTVLNITRAFNLLDILFDIFINEKRLTSFWFDSKYGWHNTQKTDTYKIYKECLDYFLNNNTFEDYLRNSDNINDLRNYT